MKPKTALWASMVGTVGVALCYFTLILVVILGVLGLGALVGYRDSILLPALGVMLVVNALSCHRDCRHSV